MVIGIDATNLNLGGGKTHILNLVEALSRLRKETTIKIIIYAQQQLLDHLPDAEFITKRTNNYLNGTMLKRYYWLLFKSKNEYKEFDILFAPSGLYFGSFRPYVTMSRNMLLFDKKERQRLNFKLRMKINISRRFQLTSLKNADGIIFISDYAKSVIVSELHINEIANSVIYHGISSKFKISPQQRTMQSAEQSSPFELLYVSHIYEYKHPWNVVHAVNKLKQKGYDVKLKIVGGGNSVAIKRLNETIESIPQHDSFIHYLGVQPYDAIYSYYKQADIFVYASTCENMPNILIEAMSSSLPIACSNYMPMPEFLADAGLYFDPLDVDSIALTLERLLLSPGLRRELSEKAFSYSNKYTWTQTAEKTLSFIESTYSMYKKNKY